MIFHPNCTRDRRSRIYIPIKRILQEKEVVNSNLLINNQEYQTVVHYLPTMTVFPPKSSVLIDFGQAIHGGIRINIHGHGSHMRIKFGESVSEVINASNQDSSRKDAIIELSDYGMNEFGNTVFRFVQIENVGTHSVNCLNIIAVALECDFEVVGSFESSDTRLNKIWETSIRTVHLCMQDFIYDGAKRDRIVWMGDMHPEVRGILSAFSEVSIIRDSFEFLMHQAPASKPMNDMYTYSCWFIISVWDYFMATNDRDFLEKHKDYLWEKLNLFATFVDDKGCECVPERRFLDWPNADNPAAMHAGIQPLLYWMMVCGEKLLNELKLDSTAITKTKTKLLLHRPDPVGRKAPAALLHLMNFGEHQNIIENDPFNDVSTFYGYYVLLAKQTIPALDLIRRYWGGMLDFGATSFWEDFDLKWTKNASKIDEMPIPGKADLHADFGNYCYVGLRHSLSHGWSCGPAPFLSERVLGVRFLTPGGSKVSINPDLGDLEFVRGSFPTPHGPIKIYADMSGKREIELPVGVSLVSDLTKK